MTPLTDLDALLRQMEPDFDPEHYAYARLPDEMTDWPAYAIACFQEKEGRSIIAPQSALRAHALDFVFPCRRITLTVHSALEAVGLTACVAQALTEAQISANVVAALHHDHVFVPDEQADQALAALMALSRSARS